jgi:hypothetical protein
MALDFIADTVLMNLDLLCIDILAVVLEDYSGYVYRKRKMMGNVELVKQGHTFNEIVYCDVYRKRDWKKMLSQR